MDPRIAAPRLETPRVVIPAGSVGIGGSQTGVYPIDSPGGWRLIGKTPLRFYDPDREEPILCRAGEYIRFVSIGEADFKKIESDVKAGSYHPQIETEEES
jgi:inhibitor of KinA